MSSIAQQTFEQEPAATKDELLEQLRQIRVSERGALLLGNDPFPATIHEKGRIVQELTEHHGMTHQDITFMITLGAR